MAITDLSRHRKEKSKNRSFEEFIAQVTTDLKKVVIELSKAQGLLKAFADYLDSIVSKLKEIGAPSDIIDTVSDFQSTIVNVSDQQLPTATDTIASTVNELQTVVTSIMNMNLPKMLEKFSK